MRPSRAALLRTGALLGVLVAAIVVTSEVLGRGDVRATAPRSGPPAAMPAPPVKAAKRSSPMLGAVNSTPPLVRSGCPGKLLSKPLPSGFRQFPLPKGTSVVNVRNSAVSGLHLVYIVGYTPLALGPAGRHFRNRLPKSGYNLTGGDAEPWEIELSFRGNGRRGALKLNMLARCPSTVAFLVGIAEPTG